MPSIHFLCRDRLNLHRVSESNEYESGNWAVSASEAEKLVGGMIYLHQKKATPSYFGGLIKSARVLTSQDARSIRYIFRFVPMTEAKEVRWKGNDHAMAWTGGVIE